MMNTIQEAVTCSEDSVKRTQLPNKKSSQPAGSLGQNFWFELETQQYRYKYTARRCPSLYGLTFGIARLRS